MGMQFQVRLVELQGKQAASKEREDALLAAVSQLRSERDAEVQVRVSVAFGVEPLSVCRWAFGVLH